MKRFALWALIVLCSAKVLGAAEVAEPTVRALQAKYGIRLIAGDVPESTDQAVKFAQLAPADIAPLKVYLRLFAQEFNKYPPAFVKACGIEVIAFTKDMTVNGQSRNAIPVAHDKMLYYDPFGGAHSEEYQRHVVHHEFFHVADNLLNAATEVPDPNWESQNDPKFHYGGGGHLATGSDQGGGTNREAGFINRYSTSGIEEDKAEIYAWMLVDTESNVLEQRARADKRLGAKVKHMREFVRYYGQEPKTERDRAARKLFASVRGRGVTAVQDAIAAEPALLKSLDYHGRSPLHWSVIMREPKVVDALLRAQADVNLADNDGWTALHTAAFTGQDDVVDLLLHAGANAGLRDARGGVALDWARLRGHRAAADLLARAAPAQSPKKP
jgi:hypothetical protein